MEIWKNIQGYQGLYQVSNLGRIKNIKTAKIRKLQVHKVKNKRRIYNKCGVCLWKNGTCKNFTLSRLVFETFSGVIPQGYQIDHINNDPTDNRLQNLQLLTASQNNKKIHIDNPSFRYDKATKIKCLNNGKIYDSQRDASKQLNVDYRSINAVLKNQRKSAKGYTFIYVDDYYNDKEKK